ncbi:PH domain-containing protein [Haloarcula onubensis]|uniref:PH domain-containing protein n=1 Tax=Haloarcula onubensis TaxID=2950539 RepID=A0ABU2FRV2_9EURY|nr:PH domain-containing protein [Halomicroarcula sp. S3CR25-11]MDS0283488.1 PH domain-containing protein [Halomicroarcula sp. S3CR25-11]
MIAANEYNALSDLESKRQEALKSLLYDDEEFIYAIDINDAFLMKKARASKLVLTNQRVIEFKRGFIKETSKDFLLDEIASIEHKKGYVKRKISLEGHGASSEYQTLQDFGRKFVTAVRKEKNHNKKS